MHGKSPKRGGIAVPTKDKRNVCELDRVAYEACMEEIVLFVDDEETLKMVAEHNGPGGFLAMATDIA